MKQPITFYLYQIIHDLFCNCKVYPLKWDKEKSSRTSLGHFCWYKMGFFINHSYQDKFFFDTISKKNTLFNLFFVIPGDGKVAKKIKNPFYFIINWLLCQYYTYKFLILYKLHKNNKQYRLATKPYDNNSLIDWDNE